MRNGENVNAFIPVGCELCGQQALSHCSQAQPPPPQCPDTSNFVQTPLVPGFDCSHACGQVDGRVCKDDDPEWVQLRSQAGHFDLTCKTKVCQEGCDPNVATPGCLNCGVMCPCRVCKLSSTSTAATSTETTAGPMPPSTASATTEHPTSADRQSKMCGNRYDLPSSNNASSWGDAGYLEMCKKDCSLDPACKAVTYEEDQKMWCFGCKDLATREEMAWGLTWKWQEVESSFEETAASTAPTTATFSMIVVSALCVMVGACGIV